MDPDRPSNTADESLLARLNRHRGMTALFLASAVAGALLGAFQLPEDIALVRRVIGGAISGAGVLFLMTATKMLN
jgi:hypothetical protein